MIRESTRPAVLNPPFLIVNPKSYLDTADTLKLAELTNELAIEYDIDTLFTAPYVDLRLVGEAAPRLITTAQHMDPIGADGGMGWVRPESLVEAGVGAVVLNHASHLLGLAALDASIVRAREVGLLSVVCADTEQQCQAVANLNPDVMICEPTANIGTGKMDDGDYIERTTRLVKDIDPSILIIQAAGVSNGSDITRVLEQGADGSGGTSGIIKHPDWRAILTDMFGALSAHKSLQAA